MVVVNLFYKVSFNQWLIKKYITTNYLPLIMYYELFDRHFCTFIEEVSDCELTNLRNPVEFIVYSMNCIVYLLALKLN